MSEEPCILVVDDELPNRFVLEAILVPAGYRVVHAKHGNEALDRIVEGGIDLVLLDILMPQLDGIETCRKIRQDLILPLMPVIMVTALSDRVSRTRSKSCGADDYLIKPIYEDELLARIRNLLMRNAYYAEAERERARAEAEAKRWKLVSDVASTVATCTDYETLQLSIRELLRPHLPIHSFVVLEVNGDTLSGSLAQSRSVAPPPAISAARWRNLWRERGVIALEPFANELAPVVAMGPNRNMVHGALLPLHVGATLQGVLALFSTRALDDDELLLVDELGPHLANAVTNVRSHVKTKHLNEARDRLSLLLVHDLKNPLSVVSMNLELLSAAGLGDEDAESLRDARTAADRMLHMIIDLLDIGCAEEGRLVLQRSRGTIDEIVNDVLTLSAVSAAQRGAQLTSDLAQGVTADVDGKLLRRVLENLVGNALRFVPRGGSIDVTSHVEDSELVLRVSNNGPSIRPEVRARMFEKYGGDAAHQSGPNRGLGLYFCRLVVEAHGGSIDAHNLAKGGVCFETRIPGAEVVALASHAARYEASLR